MVESLRQLSKDSVVDYTTRPRHEWVLDHAGQIIILTSQIYWAKGAEEALDGLLVPDDPIEGIKKWYDQTVVYLGGLIGLVRGELTKLQRGSLVALITIDVHNRDIIEYLVNVKNLDYILFERNTPFKFSKAAHMNLQIIGLKSDINLEERVRKLLNTFQRQSNNPN